MPRIWLDNGRVAGSEDPSLADDCHWYETDLAPIGDELLAWDEPYLM